MAISIHTVPKLITEAHTRWQFAANSETIQREAELDDLRFDAGKQWPADIIQARAGDQSKSIPAMPCLTISLLGQPISQIDNAQEQAQFTPSVKPVGGKGSKKNAEIARGLLRHIQNQSHALEASMWGAKRANRCGRGYWRIVSRYTDDPDVEGPAAYDQELFIDRILNQFTVYMDPTAKQVCKKDARWVVIADTITEDQYIDQYGEDDLTNCSLEEWSDIGTAYPGWVSTDEKGTRSIRVADYIRIEETTTRVVLEVKRGQTTKFLKFDVSKKEKPQAPDGWKEIDRREIKTKKVLWDTINAVKSLKSYKWPGKYLPIVEMIIEEKNVDGERIYEGLIRPAKDAQRSYNYMRSAQVMTIGLAPRAPITADTRAIAQYKNIYNNANTTNYSVLPYDSIDPVTGEEIPNARPMRDVAEPAIQAVTVAAQVAVSDVRATTKIPEVSLGQTDPRYRAKGSIQALQGQSDLATSGFLMAYRNAKAWEAEILLDLLPHYYDRPGRIIEILEGEPMAMKSVMLGQSFVPDDDGFPQEADDDHPDAEFYDLTAQKLSVVVTVGKAFPTKRSEAQSTILDMMQAGGPQISGALAPLAMQYSDAPGADEAFKVLKTILWPPALQVDDKTKLPDPSVLMQQNQQLMQQMKEMGQEMQKKDAIISGKVIEAKSREEVARIQAASAGAVAETKVNADLAETIIEQEAKKAQLVAENYRTLVDAKGKLLDHAHDLHLQEHQQAHEQKMPAVQADALPPPEPSSTE